MIKNNKFLNDNKKELRAFIYTFIIIIVLSSIPIIPIVIAGILSTKILQNAKRGTRVIIINSFILGFLIPYIYEASNNSQSIFSLILDIITLPLYIFSWPALIMMGIFNHSSPFFIISYFLFFGVIGSMLSTFFIKILYYVGLNK